MLPISPELQAIFDSDVLDFALLSESYGISPYGLEWIVDQLQQKQAVVTNGDVYHELNRGYMARMKAEETNEF